MTPQHPILGFLQNIGMPELLVVGVVALLIFGRRLPEVGRSLGKSFVEFKRGLKDTGDERKQIKSEANQAAPEDESATKGAAWPLPGCSHCGRGAG